MMARSTYKMTLLLLWVVLVREVLTQDQTLPDTAAPALQEMMLIGSRNNQESEDDAIQMGRNAAEDMGALMASPPMKTFRLPQMTNDNNQRDDIRSEFSSYANARQADLGQRPQCYQKAALQWYPGSEPSRPSERAAVGRTFPLAPLPPLPLIPGLSPIPLLSPLIQSLTNPGRLGLGFGARPLLRTALPALRTPLSYPYTPALQAPLPYIIPGLQASLPNPYNLPALRASLTPTLPALRNPLSTYQLPRMNRVWIPPSPLRARSSSTPNKYARSENQDKPLVFYT